MPTGESRRDAPDSARTRIDWGRFDLASLVGRDDAFEHTPLRPGETVVLCDYDQVAYHQSTWEFLRAQSQGRCCVCGRSDKLRTVTLPTAATMGLSPLPSAPTGPAATEEVTRLAKIWEHLGRAVLVEDYVHHVHISQKGTYFIKFENTPRPFDGFKVVIFAQYLPAWTEAGIDPRSYAGHVIRVRGVVQQHPTWGIEILVNSPRVIQVVGGQPTSRR